MIQNIPYKFNPFPVYYNGGSEPPTPIDPDYVSLPMTFECTEGSVGIEFSLWSQWNKQNANSWAGSNSPVSSLYYKKTGDTEWTDWKALGYTQVTLTAGQKLQLSGVNGPTLGGSSAGWTSYNNRFIFTGNGSLNLYGNISSLFVSGLSSVSLYSLFYQRTSSSDNGNTVLKDASKFIISYDSYGSNAYFDSFGGNNGLIKGPLYLNKNFYNRMFEYNYYYDFALTAAEVSFIKSNSWSFTDFFNSVNTTGLFIKPYNTWTPTTKGITTVPANWIILNRRSNGALYFAQNVTYNGNNYLSGELFPYTDDPYAWYYNFKPEHLTFKGTATTNAVQLSAVGTPDAITLNYSKNGGAWTAYSVGDTINLASGDIVAISGANDHFSKSDSSYYRFQMTGTIEAGGNIQSLMNYSDSCTDYCYNYLFYGCTSLITPPQLNATTLATYCYSNMFRNCTNLSTVPILPVTTLAQGCYGQMFYNCRSLTAAPYLPATTLVHTCYSGMFNGCTKLSSISVAFTSWTGAYNPTPNWVTSVQTTSGTFTCPSALSAEFGISRIPNNWTVVNK